MSEKIKKSETPRGLEITETLPPMVSEMLEMPFEPVMITSESECLNTKAICVPSEKKGLARYPPLRNYNLLKTGLEDAYDDLELVQFQGVIGNFQITFNEREITYDIYEKIEGELITTYSSLYKNITTIKPLKEFMDLWLKDF